jgi:hypothetical protein
MVTVILWLLYQQAKSLQYSLDWKNPYRLEKFKSAKPETWYIVFTLVAWTVSELQS